MIRHLVLLIFMGLSVTQVAAFEYSSGNDLVNLKATIGGIRDIRCQREPIRLQLVCYVWYRQADHLADHIMFLQQGHQLAASAGSEILLNYLEQEIDQAYEDLNLMIDHGFITSMVLRVRSPW